MSDPLLEMIAQLPPAAMAPDRALRAKARCHRALARRAKVASMRERPLRWQAWSRAVIVLTAVYFTQAVRQVLRVYGTR
jgi:hypothetical protein